MNKFLKIGLLAAVASVFSACDRPEPDESKLAPADIQYRRSGRVQIPDINEISGLQSSRRHAGLLWAHDDSDTPALLALDVSGTDLGRVMIEGVRNRDWEDITLVPGEHGDLLVVANTGDNRRRYSSVSLLFVREPEAGEDGRFRGSVTVHHALKLHYPDHKQDTEAVAFDPIGERLLLLSKRSQPPRLYGLGLDRALAQDEATLEFLGEVDNFRPPAFVDHGVFGNRTSLVSQPTGMDISPDGSRAAVITYRSLYLFTLGDARDWSKALKRDGLEILGPEALREEAITFSPDGLNLYVTSEGRGAPIYHFRWPRTASD